MKSETEYENLTPHEAAEKWNDHRNNEASFYEWLSGQNATIRIQKPKPKPKPKPKRADGLWRVKIKNMGFGVASVAGGEMCSYKLLLGSTGVFGLNQRVTFLDLTFLDDQPISFEPKPPEAQQESVAGLARRCAKDKEPTDKEGNQQPVAADFPGKGGSPLKFTAEMLENMTVKQRLILLESNVALLDYEADLRRFPKE